MARTQNQVVRQDVAAGAEAGDSLRELMQRASMIESSLEYLRLVCLSRSDRRPILIATKYMLFRGKDTRDPAGNEGNTKSNWNYYGYK